MTTGSVANARQSEAADAAALERILTMHISLSGPDGRDWVNDALDAGVGSRFIRDLCVDCQAAARGDEDFAETGRRVVAQVFAYIRSSPEYARVLESVARDMVTPDGPDDEPTRLRLGGAL